MNKNDEIELNITAMSSDGVGIGRFDGMAVFVDNTAVGDTVKAHIIKVKSRYAIAIPTKIINPSPDRKEQSCPSFKSCGGCSYRHINYEAELKIKQSTVNDAINRIGGIPLESNNIVPSPKICAYRNKAQYPVAQKGNEIVYGFYAKHSHRVINGENCLLQPPIFDGIMQIIKHWAQTYKISAYNEESKSGILRHIIIRYAETSGEIMVMPVINADVLPKSEELKTALIEKIGKNLKCIAYNVNKKDTNVITGDKCVFIYGNQNITDEICGVKLKISPLSFYQVNRSAAELLYTAAAKYIDNSDKILIDLFCGIGSIGLSIMNLTGDKSKKLYGVEIIPDAVENARQNAVLNGVDNAEFICSNAAVAAKTLETKGVKPDVVIVDPPRKGCTEDLLNTIVNGFMPKKLIYISCDPATLARDVKIMSSYGYTLQEYTPFDLFPKTNHVETCVLITRDKKGQNS